jgi:hypothetical protein
LKTSSADAVAAMRGRAARAPAKQADVIFLVVFLLNAPLDVARIDRLPVCSFDF